MMRESIEKQTEELEVEIATRDRTIESRSEEI